MSIQINSCWLCDTYKLNQILNLPSEDTFICDSTNFSTSIDIAPSKIGHLLTISKQHLTTIEQLNKMEKNELFQHLDEVTNIYKDDVISYCHITPNKENKCLEHLHFHILPTETPPNNIQNFLTSHFTSYLLIEGGNKEDQLLIFYNGALYTNKNATGSTLRKKLEVILSADSRPWKQRVYGDEAKLYELIIKTKQLLKCNY